jgi:hypothetical protein
VENNLHPLVNPAKTRSDGHEAKQIRASVVVSRVEYVFTKGKTRRSENDGFVSSSFHGMLWNWSNAATSRANSTSCASSPASKTTLYNKMADLDPKDMAQEF